MTLILIIIFISILILVHELGHFYAARKFNVRVDEFGFGFPPKIFSRVKNGIRYSINLLPFGGFVKIFGEHGEGEGAPDSFISRPAWQRFVILFAGVGMNFMLAWILFSIGSIAGVPRIVDEKDAEIPVSIITVAPNSPADEAGLRFGDKILEIRAPETSLRIETEADVIEFVEAYRGEEITLIVERGERVLEISATPRGHVPEGEGPLGIALARLTVDKTPWYLAPWEGGKIFLRSVFATVQGLGIVLKELVTEGRAPQAVSGPIGIFSFAQDTRALGFAYFLQFVGILSVNLGILNFLPIPALDGGRILFLLIEKIRGTRIHPAVENAAHTFGFLLLVLLMILVTYRDVTRIL